MDRGKLQIYFGSGKGKTTAALGQAIREASGGKSVIIIQFLKGKQPEQISFIQRLEPEIKLFRFQRREAAFEELGEKEREEEIMTMKNGLDFAKKVLATGECDVLVLDEILGLLDYGIADVSDIRAVLYIFHFKLVIYLHVYTCVGMWQIEENLLELNFFVHYLGFRHEALC